MGNTKNPAPFMSGHTSPTINIVLRAYIAKMILLTRYKYIQGILFGIFEHVMNEFAMAFLSCILFDEDPKTWRFDEKLMWESLLQMFYYCITLLLVKCMSALLWA